MKAISIFGEYGVLKLAISKNLLISLGIIAVILLFASYLFGVTGLRMIAGFILMTIPAIILLNQFSLDTEEEVIISVFLSLVFFPLLVWYLNWIVPSLRVTIGIVFFLLLFGALAARKFLMVRNKNI